ncbi:MAG TPA: DUF748 domain-containing protein [Burkholderiaceae bacterium]|nr:DUF748 domain-containing protein [Burkholderiaceae bacterium]
MVAASRIAMQAGHIIRHRRTRKIALWAGGVAAAIALLGFVVAPPIVKHQLERILAEKLHRPVAIERVRINPFAPSATVAGFAVMERTGDATAVSFDELHVNLAYSSLWRRAPIVQALRLTRPHVRIVRNEDKTYNFQDLIDELAAAPPAPAPAGPPPRFAVFNIEVSEGRIDFDDRLEKETHAVTELRLGVPFISSSPSQVDITVQPALSTKINGAPFSLAGETKPFKDTRETTLHLRLADLQIAKYLEYVPVPLRFRLAHGRLDTQLVIKLSTLNEKLHTFTLAGTAAVRQLAMQTNDGAPLLALDALQVDLESLDLVGGAAKLKRVAVEAPDVHVVRGKDGRINLLGLVDDPPAAPRAQTGNATGAPPKETGNATGAPPQAGNAGHGDAAPFTVSVADVSINGGTVHIVDAVPQRPFEATLNNVALALSNLVLPPAKESAATVELAVGIEPKGRLTYKGALQLAPLHSEGRLTLEGLRLAAFVPYYEGLVNVIVTGGQLTTQGDLAVDIPDGKPLQVAYRGDATVSGFASLDKPTSQELLRWKQLAVSGIDFKLAPLNVAISRIALADFYSRLIVNNDGTLNLQKILVESAAEQKTTATAADGARAAAPTSRHTPSSTPATASSAASCRSRPSISSRIASSPPRTTSTSIN